MRIRVKRVGSPTSYNTWGMEHDFVNATTVRYPKKGEVFVFVFDRVGKGWWTTSNVQEVITRPGEKIFVTRNAKYHVKKGWDDKD